VIRLKPESRNAMIINTEGMKSIEKNSGLSTLELMENAGKKVAEKLRDLYPSDTKLLVLAGKGNNGGDAFVAARYLKDWSIKVCDVDGSPKSREAKLNHDLLKHSVFLSKNKIKQAADWSDVILDGVYGFGYKGELSANISTVFQIINESHKPVISIDINSGCEADTGYCADDAIHSSITLALDCRKPFHMLRKEHHMFEQCETLDLNLPHPTDIKYTEMNEELFFHSYPRKPENAYKGTYGKTLLVGGSYGMSGAVCLNILGAKTVGSSYINVALPHDIYQIVASRNVTPVFHPFGKDTMSSVLGPLIHDARSISFGSGTGNMEEKNECMDFILQHSKAPVVLDAEALRMLQYNTYIFHFIKCPVILTPHIGEFAYMINQPVSAVIDHKIEYASDFAIKNKVYIVLKGPNTVVISPKGECYINQSGNQALAQAGSGDLLTGMIAGILTATADVYRAVCMAVWLHGYLADIGLKDHSIQNFPIEDYPSIMDRLFKKHGY
jgi:NAD(P)H-hydrate epimerase